MTEKEMEQLKWAVAQIRDAIEGGFYGEITFKFQSGRVVNAESKESRKPPS